MSIVVYRGPSALDPTVTIMGIVTFDSANEKTGPMAQLWIVPQDEAPHQAQRTGGDAAVCGDCKFRPILTRARNASLRKSERQEECYVIAFQGPLATWRANRDKPVDLAGVTRRLSYGASLRLGAYGDPAALPETIIRTLSAACGMRITGYTHAWRNPAFAYLKGYVMASCDEVTDYARAKAEGWRTFRVLQKTHLPVLAKREIHCPSEKGVECIRCKLCNGLDTHTAKGERIRPDNRKDIAILAH